MTFMPLNFGYTQYITGVQPQIYLRSKGFGDASPEKMALLEHCLRTLSTIVDYENYQEIRITSVNLVYECIYQNI